MSTFVFFHVGENTFYPQKMVNSLRACMPKAEVIMCTSPGNPVVDGVDDVVRVSGSFDYLMVWRLEAFAALNLDKAAMYIDTDMLFRASVNVKRLLGDKTAMFCSREYNRDTLFNPEQAGMSFPEYANRTMACVYPYIACATITRDGSPWAQMSKYLSILDERFKRWYGDQEAIRMYASDLDREAIGFLPESVYACLPEHDHPEAKIMHYKGPARKPLFEQA